MSIWTETKRSSKTELRKLKSDNLADGMIEACRSVGKNTDYETIKIGSLGNFTHKITKDTLDTASYLGCVDKTLWEACD